MCSKKRWVIGFSEDTLCSTKMVFKEEWHFEKPDAVKCRRTPLIEPCKAAASVAKTTPSIHFWIDAARAQNSDWYHCCEMHLYGHPKAWTFLHLSIIMTTLPRCLNPKSLRRKPIFNFLKEFVVGWRNSSECTVTDDSQREEGKKCRQKHEIASLFCGSRLA